MNVTKLGRILPNALPVVTMGESFNDELVWLDLVTSLDPVVLLLLLLLILVIKAPLPVLCSVDS